MVYEPYSCCLGLFGTTRTLNNPVEVPIVPEAVVATADQLMNASLLHSVHPL